MADREALRAELETTRAAFHELLNSLSPADLRRRSGNAAWTVGQLIYHLAWAAGFVPSGVQSARKGRGFNPPAFLADRVNVIATRLGARRATKSSIAAKYDAAHAKILAALGSVGDGDWQRGVKTFGEYLTVGDVFHSVARHFEENAADIRHALEQQ